jgi:hypothetical protein
MGLTGAVSEHGPEGIATANAAILRGAAAAVAPAPGSIVVERYHSVARAVSGRVHPSRGHAQPPGALIDHFDRNAVTEVPAPGGAPNQIYLSDSGLPDRLQFGVVDGVDQLYDPSSNTVYIVSAYGPYITHGPRPGTYVYTPLRRSALPRDAAARITALPAAPLMISARQRRGLLNGTLIVAESAIRAGERPTDRVIAPLPMADDVTLIRRALAAHRLQVTGPVTIGGRSAIKLASPDGRLEADVSPRTYAPIRTVRHGDGAVVTTDYGAYQVLPATRSNRRRLLDLAYRHPGARIDRSPIRYAAAFARIFGYSPTP